MRFWLTHRFRATAIGVASVKPMLTATAYAVGHWSRRVGRHGGMPSESPARALRENVSEPGGNSYLLAGGLSFVPVVLIEPVVAW